MLKKRKTNNTPKKKVLKNKNKKDKGIVTLSPEKRSNTKIKKVVKKVVKKIVSKVEKTITTKKKVPKQDSPKVIIAPKKKDLKQATQKLTTIFQKKIIQVVTPISKITPIQKKIKSKLRKKFRRVEAVCLLTGITKRFSCKRAKILAAKLNFISVDIFKENFLSRDACTLLKQGFSEAEIKLKFNFKSDRVLTFDVIKKYIKSFNYKEKMMRKRKRKIVNDLIDLQNSDNKIVADYKPVPINFKDAEQVAYLTKDVCIRPDIHLNGNHSCNFCPHFELCICKRKYWNKKISKTDDKPNKKLKRL